MQDVKGIPRLSWCLDYGIEKKGDGKNEKIWKRMEEEGYEGARDIAGTSDN